MLRYLPLLLRVYQSVKMRHLRWAAGLFVLAICGCGAGAGAMTYGWQGALLAPLGLLLMMALALHLFIVISLALGMRSYRRKQPRAALMFLWVAAVFRSYDRSGKANLALVESRNLVTAQMMQKMAMNFLSRPR